ncbi:MAG: TraR/DksA C4-type zinc finger protein [Limnochordia bacterium]|jgi:RNA polymerase-binding transcription factor DksA
MTSLSHNEAYKNLEAEYERLWNVARSLRQALAISETDAVGELSGIDQHTGDLGAETIEREKDLGLLLATYIQLEQVLQAKDRLEQGTYGLCDDCGQTIDIERLRALPAADLCVACKSRREQERERSPSPADNEAIVSNTLPTDTTPGIDGQDIWAQLAPYGTANSPQDAPHEDLPEALWQDLFRDFPDNPESEMAMELTPVDAREIARDYNRAERDERRRTRK